MIEVQNLTYSYPGSHRKVFDDFGVRMEPGRIYGLLGRNGTGKSTLLYLLSGLLRPRCGHVFVDGMEASLRDPQMLSRMFVVPEEFGLPETTLEQYVRGIRPFYPKFREEVLRDCLAAFEMPQDNVSLGALSMGQKKKVFLSVAAAACTEWLIMDEPTNGLDIPSKALFRQVMGRYVSPDTTLIISTHQVHDVEQLLDHILILDGSRLLCDASVADITARYGFGLRQATEMDDDVLYAEPSLQGNSVMVRRAPGAPETQLNLELFFTAVTKGVLGGELV